MCVEQFCVYVCIFNAHWCSSSLSLQLFIVWAAHTDLMSLIHRLLSIVQLFIEVSLLFAEQIL